MKRQLSKMIKGESGQALPIVLALLFVGGLLITPTLSYAATSLNSGQVVEKNLNALYAADAGIENSLWKLKNSRIASYPHSYELPNVNGLSVTVDMEQVTTVYGINVGSSGENSDQMEVDGSMTYNDELEAYVYTVTITNKRQSIIHIDKILVQLPEDFEYVLGLTGGAFTTDDPEIRGDPDSGITLIWDFQSPRPYLENAPDPENSIYTIATQTFQLNGATGYSGDNDYTWVVAQRQDIGSVGEVDAYQIMAQAKDGETVLITIKAYGLKDAVTNEVLVMYWEINPPPEVE